LTHGTRRQNKEKKAGDIMQRIVSLVGMLGTGKTTALKQLALCGYSVIPEGYVAISKVLPCDNRFILSKWAWISDWFNKVHEYLTMNPGVPMVIVDRNAIEAGLWTESCTPLFEPLARSLVEFETFDYCVTNICLRCDEDVLRQRISSRLIVEPQRRDFHESDSVFLFELNKVYAQNEHLWDYIIDTTALSPKQVVDSISEIIRAV
jgi:broad-specificity NMP kinase